MAAVTEAGAIYAQPKSLADMIDHTLGRVLDLFDIDIDIGKVQRWTGGKGTRRFRPAGHGADWDAVPKPDLVD